MTDRAEILQAVLRHVPFDGWRKPMLEAAAADCGLQAAEIYRYFPGGIQDIVDFWLRDISQEMTDVVAASEETSVTKRIRLAVLTRFQIMTPDRETVRQTMIYFSFPGRQQQAGKALYHTVDAMWHAAGVYDTDFNFYTKRLLLSGVYSSSLLFWLTEEGADEAALADFVDRRLAGIMKIQKRRGRMEKRLGNLCKKLPSPLAMAVRARYGRPPLQTETG